MSKQQFRVTNFREDTLSIIAKADAVIAEYDGQKLSARQVYYRFIGDDLLPASWIDAAYNARMGLPADTKNTPKNYQRLISVLVDARYAGLISWDAIEDRGRSPSVPNEWDSVDDIVDQVSCSGCNAFVDDREGRKCAACGEDCGVTALAFDAEGGTDFDKEVRLLYLGDHDPSGEDMVRDIRDRLAEFGVPNLTVEKIALTMPQIRRFNPPPNPAKITDSRAKAYIAKFGSQSWEVDALPPRELNRTVEQAIARHVDKDLMDAVIKREDAERARVRAAIERSRQ